MFLLFFYKFFKSAHKITQLEIIIVPLIVITKRTLFIENKTYMPPFSAKSSTQTKYSWCLVYNTKVQFNTRTY